MAFTRAKIVIKEASVGTGVKTGLAKTEKSSAKMKISIAKGVADTFGFADGDKLEVLIGTAEDHGAIRIRKNNSNGEAVVNMRGLGKGKTYAQVNLGYQEAFVNRREAARWCQFEKVEEGWIQIILPKWADETGPKKKPADVSKGIPVAVSSPVGVARGAVTSTLMGDPPPGRREMLSKVGNM